MEIDKREERPTLFPPSKKHQSPSPDGRATDGEPKHRKHHHRHSRHRHRHYSQWDREKDASDENKERVLDDEMAEGVIDENQMVEDGELEE